MKKRIISAALLVCMLLCLLPTTALATVGAAAKRSDLKPDTRYFMRVAIDFVGQYCIVSQGDPGLGTDYCGFPLPSKTEGARAVFSPIPDSRLRLPLSLRHLAVELEPEGKKFRIKISHSGLYLTAQGEGAYVVQLPKDSSQKQLFELVDEANRRGGFYVKASDGTYLTMEGVKSDLNAGTGLIAAPPAAGKIPSQAFTFCPVYTDDPKMSDWAKPYLGYMPRDTAYGNDFTKKFTMTSTALFDIVTGVLPGNPKFLPGAIADTAVGEESDGVLWRLKYWGILPAPEIPSGSKTTKEGLAVYLMRTIRYINKYNYQNSIKLSRADLSQYADGRQVSSWAKDAMAVMVAHGIITPVDGKLNPKSDVSIEEMLMMCGRVRAVVQKANDAQWMLSGVHSIRNRLGNNLAINAEGQGELNASAQQNFRFTYKYTQATSRNDCGHYYTIQTLDGKYLAIEGTATEGSRLIARDKEYIWRVIYSGSEDYQSVYVFMPGQEATIRVLGAYQGQTKDGTPLVTWKKGASATEEDWKVGGASRRGYEANAKFYVDAPVNYDPSKPPPTTSVSVASQNMRPEPTASAEEQSVGDNLQDGVYQLVTANNTKNCVGIGSSSMAEGAAAVTWTNMNIDDQKFTIQKQGARYSITAVHSGLALTINGGDVKGAKIVQKTYTGSAAQLFDIVDAGNGYVNIVSGKGLCFGVGGGKTTKGAEIVLWTATKASDQQFKLAAAT